MRWTIPTLLQQLVDQGVRPGRAADIVTVSYPDTRGDTFYRWQDPTDPTRVAVGVYALWNSLRGDQSPLSGTKVSDDARTIGQFGRLNGWKLEEIVKFSTKPDYVISQIAQQAASMIANGDYFQPREVEPDDPLESLPAQLARGIAVADGAWDYVRTIPKPHFGG